MHAAMTKERDRQREVVPGAWVKAAREIAGVRSQMDLAVAIRRDKATVTRWEGTDGEIDYISWVGVLGVLGLPIDWEPGHPLPSGWKLPSA